MGTNYILYNRSLSHLWKNKSFSSRFCKSLTSLGPTTDLFRSGDFHLGNQSWSLWRSWKSVLGMDMGVSKNRGTPKWMVKIMENPIKIDDLGVPLFFGNTHIVFLPGGYHPVRLWLGSCNNHSVKPFEKGPLGSMINLDNQWSNLG